MKRARILAQALLALALASCGGGGTSSPAERAPAQYSTRMMVQAPTAVQDPGFNASATFPPDTEPAASIARQAAMPGDVIVTMMPFKDWQFTRLDEWLAIANTYPQVKWIYVYDELFWADGRITIGLHDAPVSAAARAAKRAGFKSAVSIMPDVVLAPDFALQDANAFDVIIVDVYPSLLLSGDTHGCGYNANRYTTILACSVKKLRAIGFTGEVWYVYQAFGDTRDANLVAELQQQQETIHDGPGLGVTGVVAFGFYSGAVGASSDVSMQPPLYAGKGSAFEHLLTLN